MGVGDAGVELKKQPTPHKPQKPHKNQTPQKEGNSLQQPHKSQVKPAFKAP